MGGRPNPGTSKDKRLAANKPAPKPSGSKTTKTPAKTTNGMPKSTKQINKTSPARRGKGK